MAGSGGWQIPHEQKMVWSVDQGFALDRFLLCQLRQNPGFLICEEKYWFDAYMMESDDYLLRTRTSLSQCSYNSPRDRIRLALFGSHAHSSD